MKAIALDRFLAVNKAVKRWSIFLRHGRTGRAIVGGIWIASIVFTIPIAYLHEITSGPQNGKCRMNFMNDTEKCQFLNSSNPDSLISELNETLQAWTAITRKNLIDGHLTPEEKMSVDQLRTQSPLQCDIDP